MSRFHLLLAALLLASPGCAKMAAESSAPPSTADYGGSGGMGGMPAPEPAMAPAGDAEAVATRDGYIAESDDKARDEGVTQPTGSFGAPTQNRPSRTPTELKTEEAPAKKTPQASEGKGEDSDPPKQFARQIIYTAELVMSVFKLEEAMQRAEQLTLEVGGYVQQMSTGYFVLRIPAAHLRKVMDELTKLGVVESRVMSAQDVTQEFFDLQTRIRVLKETQTQLIALLKQARNVEEALNVRRSLDAITMELEQAIGRMRLLENMIGYSTLTLRMSERGPSNTIPSSNDPFPWVDTLGVEATEWN